MIKRNKRISIGSLLVNLILLTLAILCTTLKKDIFYAWYWMLVTLMLLFEILYVFIWSKVGRNLDKHKSNTINRSFNDVTAVSIVLSGLIYLVVLFCEFYNKSIHTSLYAIWSMYLCSIIQLSSSI